MDKFNELGTVNINKPHVFILGAGASIASFPDGDKNQKKLPSMINFVETLDIATLIPDQLLEEDNFEVIYSKLCANRKYHKQKFKIEQRIHDYFSELSINEEACIYDYLLLSLRPKDIIATFNWDPFLIQAYIRNDNKFNKKLPSIWFLHGNVEAYYCESCLFSAKKGYDCPKCYKELVPSKLLYPVGQKNYDDDSHISSQWKALQFFLKEAYMLSIFGYSAPKSDISAKEKIFEAWRGYQNDKHRFDMVEIIDRPNCDEKKIKSTWDDFIFSHHSRVYGDIFECFALRHPRRSGEAYVEQYFNAQFIPDNLPPRTKNLDELWNWFEGLINAENYR